MLTSAAPVMATDAEALPEPEPESLQVDVSPSPQPVEEGVALVEPSPSPVEENAESAAATTTTTTTAIQSLQALDPNSTVTVVTAPEYRSAIATPTIDISFYNGQGTEAIVYSQKQPTDLDIHSMGSRDIIGEVDLVDGHGSVQFNATEYPLGPIAVRIQVLRDGSVIDNAYLQLYNEVGVDWRAGLANAPVNPVTTGMDVVFADDFTSMPSISRTGIGTTYASAKPDETRGGMFGWAAFEDADGPYNPFSIAGDEYLRMTTTYHPTGYVRDDYWNQRVSTGFLSSMDQAGGGFYTEGGRNQYFEARMFFGGNPGMWPAFWTLTANGYVENPDRGNLPDDELDIIEGYMGTPSGYQIAWHPWSYDRDPDSGYNPQDYSGGTWVELDNETFGNIDLGMGFHTLAVYITEQWTYYYANNEQVAQHRTLPYSWEYGNYFMINAALSDHYGISPNAEDPFENFDVEGGFTRYGNSSDMYVDWVRVYEDAPGTVRFESQPTVRALAGSTATVTVNRNDAAAALEGHYRIETPAGWQIIEGSEGVDVGDEYLAAFTPASSDTFTFLVADDFVGPGEITLTPVANSTSYAPVVIRADSADPEGDIIRVDESTYRYRGTGGGSAGSWLDYDTAANPQEYFTFLGGNWWRDNWSWMYVASIPEHAMQFTFDGVGVALDLIQCTECGAIDIYLDGVFQDTFDSYGQDGHRVRAFDIRGLEDGEHVLEIRGADSELGRFIRIDGFGYRHIEDVTASRFWTDDTFFTAGPGDVLDITIQRNVAAGTRAGTYVIDFPSDGWQLWDGSTWTDGTVQGFSSNHYADTIRVRVGEGYDDKEGVLTITPTNDDGPTPAIRVSVQAPDAPEVDPIVTDGVVRMVDVNTHPFVLREGEEWHSWSNFDTDSHPIDYFTFDGGWWNDGWGWMYTSASPDQTLTFTFEGDSVALYGRYHDSGSQFDVYLDGEFQTSVDLFGTSGTQRVFSASGLEAAEHTLEIRITGTAGSVALDGFEYGHVVAGERVELTVDPASAEPGDEVAVSGRGFDPGETVTITLGAVVIGTTTADDSGAIEDTVTVPEDTVPDAYQLTATGNTSGRFGSADLEVTAPVVAPGPQVSIGQSSVEAGSSVTVTGSGFVPGETVSVTLEAVEPEAALFRLVMVLNAHDAVLGTSTADGDGRFALTVTIPQDTEPGQYRLTATGAVSGLSGSVNLEVVAAGELPVTPGLGTPPGTGTPTPGNELPDGSQRTTPDGATPPAASDGLSDSGATMAALGIAMALLMAVLGAALVSRRRSEV